VSAIMNCSSARFEAPDTCTYVQCALDDADTSLSLQRQKAMDLISSTRHVSDPLILQGMLRQMLAQAAPMYTRGK
jgi:hypothetical protein